MPWVRSYVRSDGNRSVDIPGGLRARDGKLIFSVVAIAVVGLGNGNVSAGGEGTPRPQSTVQYPIRFDNAPARPTPKPRPTVSYPIRWER